MGLMLDDLTGVALVTSAFVVLIYHIMPLGPTAPMVGASDAHKHWGHEQYTLGPSLTTRYSCGRFSAKSTLSTNRFRSGRPSASEGSFKVAHQRDARMIGS